jgi:hypothetical protein
MCAHHSTDALESDNQNSHLFRGQRPCAVLAVCSSHEINLFLVRKHVIGSLKIIILSVHVKSHDVLYGNYKLALLVLSFSVAWHVREQS